MQQRAGDSLEFIENVKIDLFPDEVYIFLAQKNYGTAAGLYGC